MGYMDLGRARREMRAADLDALLVLSPRHFYYATGHSSWFLNLYGEPGYGAAVISANAEQAPGALISDVEEGPFRAAAPEFSNLAIYPVWVAYADVPPITTGDAHIHLAEYDADQPDERSGQVDVKEATDLLIDLLSQMGLLRARIGIELAFAAGPVLERLRAALPDCHFVDALPLLQNLRAVKSPQEVGLLRRGTQLAEAAIRDAMHAVKPGMAAGEIARRYRAAVFEQAAQVDGPGEVTSARITLRVGPHVLQPEAAGAYRVQSGDMIFMDCGVAVSDYWADMGRCFVLGNATPVQRQIYAALRAGFDAATERLYVGNAPASVFDAGLAAVHHTGMVSYVRGNSGHGVGLHRAPELPILSRDETRTLAPGHVISVEFPYYIQGIGAFQIEDTFHLTDEGRAVFNQLSRELVAVG